MIHDWPIIGEQVGTCQWIFDQVVRHYREQPRRCPLDGMCFYRFNGDKCWVGALIPDELYHPDMEGPDVDYLARTYPSLPAWFRDESGFLGRLQAVHDSETNWAAGMDNVLEKFAEEHGLRMPS